jgi:hypothetical protein
MPQWAVIGCPGQTGQASAAASSQSVKAKSSFGAFGPVNSVQLFERMLLGRARPRIVSLA